jgi:hypothetical protein
MGMGVLFAASRISSRDRHARRSYLHAYRNAQTCYPLRIVRASASADVDVWNDGDVDGRRKFDLLRSARM